MNVDTIDICIPDIDIQNNPNVSSIMERFPNLPQKLSILACFPTSYQQNELNPLLSNIPHM